MSYFYRCIDPALKAIVVTHDVLPATGSAQRLYANAIARHQVGRVERSWPDLQGVFFDFVRDRVLVDLHDVEIADAISSPNIMPYMFAQGEDFIDAVRHEAARGEYAFMQESSLTMHYYPKLMSHVISFSPFDLYNIGNSDPCSYAWAKLNSKPTHVAYEPDCSRQEFQLKKQMPVTRVWLAWEPEPNTEFRFELNGIPIYDTKVTSRIVTIPDDRICNNVPGGQLFLISNKRVRVVVEYRV